MSAKILVADDSATIQKVVKITLSDEPFEVIEALSEIELFAALKSDTIDLVLLDFNLSEEKTGYQLAEEITKQYNSTPVMAMLGTFDSIDDNQLKINGVQDKIVKPFDSQRFVEKCHALIEFSEQPEVEEEIDLLESEEEVESSIDEEEAEQWVMERPHEELESEEESVPVEEILGEQISDENNELDEAVENWKGDVPGVIGTDEVGRKVKPPVIQEDELELESDDSVDLDSTSTYRLEDIDEQFAQKTPADDDLEYPETIEMYKPGPVTSEETESPVEPISPLISLEELTPEDDDDDDLTDQPINIEPNLELEREVQKEVSPDEFWAVDEEIDEEQEEQEEVEIQGPLEDNVDYNKLVDALKEKLSPFIENIVKDICTQSVEKISWEVIPDLAENLIRKELKEISQDL